MEAISPCRKSNQAAFCLSRQRLAWWRAQAWCQSSGSLFPCWAPTPFNTPSNSYYTRTNTSQSGPSSIWGWQHVQSLSSEDPKDKYLFVYKPFILFYPQIIFSVFSSSYGLGWRRIFYSLGFSLTIWMLIQILMQYIWLWLVYLKQFNLKMLN